MARTSRSNAGLLIPLLLVVAVVSACNETSKSATIASNAPANVVVTDPPSTPAAPVHTTQALPPTKHRTTATKTGASVLAAGVVLPNRALTPGATNPAVTQSNIDRTICLTGYTKTIRPSSSYTTALKRQQLAAGYNYHGDLSTSDYEEDHLISLELGGSPTSVQNLWPEPYAAAEGARVKDKIENELHDLVCSGQLTLRAAQRAIATNWWAAYQTYGGEGGAPQVYLGSYASIAPSQTVTSGSSTSSSSSSSGATAQCNDGSYSYSQHRSGTCSRHGGVARWINPPPS